MVQLDTPSLTLIGALAFAAACVAVGTGSLLLRVGRRWPLTRQLWVVVLAPIASIVAASLTVASAMFLSTHDLTVTLWITAVAGVVSLVPATLLGRSFLRTTQELLDSARVVGTGATVRSGRHRSVELSDLAAELDATSVRLTEARRQLEQVDESRRDLVAWVSHDLRTPLASARAMAEALEDGLVDDPARYHRGILTQVDRLSQLVDDLFELSKLSAGGLRLQRTTVSVYDLVSDQIADLAPIAAERRVRIEASGDLDTSLEVDPHHVARALANLLTNAVTHSPPDAAVDVSVQAEDTWVDIAVTDRGAGISVEDLPHVFDQGWRADAARRSGRNGGSGLGLAIVRGIADAHGGAVTAQSGAGGARFVLHLPRSTAPGV